MQRHEKGISAEKLILLAGSDWENFSFGRDGLFYLDGWRRGFTPAEIRKQFFDVQLVRNLQSQIEMHKKDAEQAITDAQDAERLAGWYRSQLLLESRFGMVLASIAG